MDTVQGVPAVPGLEAFQQIGSGGFSTVWRAHQPSHRRDVAVKVLAVRSLGDDARRDFELESQAQGQVSQHPNIVTIYDSVWTTDGRPAIIMEWFAGGTYSDRLREHDRGLPLEDVLRLGVRVAGALQTAHDVAILHRDLKPQNLFLSGFGEPALGDFGISAFADEAAEAKAAFSIHYAPPEALERRLDPRSDVYSLAASLYTLLANRRPFWSEHGDNGQSEVLRRVMQQPPPPIEGLPEPVARVLRHALAKRPEERPLSAARFGELLRDAERAVGLPQTRLPVLDARLLGDRPAAATAAAAPMDPDLSVTVMQPIDPDEATPAPIDEAPTPTRPAWVRAAVPAAGVALAGAIVAAALTAGGDAEPAPSATVDDVLPPDDELFLDALTVPDDVVVRRTAEGVEVRWVGEAAGFVVERVDGEGGTSRADASPLLLDVGADERPCVQVSAVGERGRQSAPSPVVCLEE